MAVNLGSAVAYLDLDTKGFDAGVGKFQSAMQTMQSDSAKFGDKMQAAGSQISSAGSALTKGLTVPLIGAGAVAVKQAATFESAMSQVQATMSLTKDSVSNLNGETVNTMEALGGLAQQMGAETKFSATEAAEAINNMAMAGYDVQEIFQALPGVMNLASAGALDLDYATQLSANGLNAMGLGVESLDEMTDKLASTASNAYGSVADFGEGLLITGGQASLCNLSLTDTFTALGILGNNGISAAEGGTMLRNVLKNLYTPTDSAAKVLDELGVTTENADGSLRNVHDVLLDLNGALDQLSEADRVNVMAKIFDTRTIAGASALLKGVNGEWDDLHDAIDNSAGAAERMADTQLDNLNGQLVLLKSAVEGIAISFGNILLPAIKDVVDFLQGLADKLNNLTDDQKERIVKIAETLAVLGPALLIFGKIVSFIGLISNGIPTIISLLGGLLSPIGLIIAGIGLLAAAYMTNFGGLRDKINEFIEWLSELFGSWFEEHETLLSSWFETIKEAFSAFWEGIEALFSGAIDLILGLLKGLIQIATGDVEGGFQTILAGVESFWQNLYKALGKILEGIIKILVQLIATVYVKAKEIITNFWKGCKEIWANVKAWFELAKDDPVKAFTQLIDALRNVGRKIIEGLLSGFKSAFTAVRDWVLSAVDWVRNTWNRAVGAVSAKNFGKTKGHFATGLDYVPRTMQVTVHEGERILTKQQNRDKSNGTNITVYVNAEVANDYDVDRLGNKLGKAVRNQIRSTGGGLAWS